MPEYFARELIDTSQAMALEIYKASFRSMVAPLATQLWMLPTFTAAIEDIPNLFTVQGCIR